MRLRLFAFIGLCYLTLYPVYLSGQTKKEIRHILKDQDTVQLAELIANGYDINSPVGHTSSLLNKAILHDKYALTYYILHQPGAKLNTVEKSGGQTLHYLISNGWYDLAKFIIERGINPNLLAYQDKHILVNVIFGCYWIDSAKTMDFLTFLFNHGVEIPDCQDCCNGKGWTLLMRSMTACDTTIAQFILDRENSLNKTDSKNRTALHWAVRAGRPEMVGLLLRNGVNTGIKDEKGQTALDYAVKLKESKIAAMLKAAQP